MHPQSKHYVEPEASTDLGEHADSSIELKQLICFNFYRGWRMISEYYRSKLSVDVSPQVTYILELCELHTGVDVGQIASALEIDPSAVSAMLKRMDTSGLTRRAVNPDNRRHTLVFLTQEGAELRELIRSEMIMAERDLREHVGHEDVDMLCDLVERIKVASRSSAN